MRILQLVHQYIPENIGGTELYTYWLSESLVQQGYNVAVFYRRSADGTGITRRFQNGQEIWCAWSGLITPFRRFWATFYNPALTKAFLQVLDEFQPDLVHIQHLMGHPAHYISYLKEKGIPYVITLHDFWWICANAQLLTNYSQELCAGPHLYLNCAECALSRLGRARYKPVLPIAATPLAMRNYLLRKVIAGAEALIAPSKFVRQWYLGQGIPEDKIYTVAHGVKVDGLVSSQKREPHSPVRFAYLGGFSWQKGVHIAVEAFTGLKGSAELWLIGDDTAFPDYTAYLRSLATSNVHFLGHQDRAGVWKTLAQVDILVVPSLWYETFAFVISEAFAAGVPVIASSLGPLKDRIKDEVDGLLVPPGDKQAMRAAMQRFLDDPELILRLRSGITPPDTIEKHSRMIEEIYKAIV
ncbi:MAG: glycosyltransferase [Calditrichaeota bacterium]|nr:MAG: glycosyltransferase [Calditrichota bacterium]